MRINDVMTTKVVQVRPDDTVDHARTLMRLHGVGQLVVVEDRAIRGILTVQQAEDAPQGDAAVEDVMTRQSIASSPGLTVRKAANILRGNAVAALPVVDRGRLVGIVTVGDLLEAIGRGIERPVQKGKRWTLRHRGVRPAQVRAARH
jgi:CBS domain-containing protein